MIRNSVHPPIKNKGNGKGNGQKAAVAEAIEMVDLLFRLPSLC